MVFYCGLLLFFISGPSRDDVEDLRTIAFWVLLLSVVASATLILLGARMFSIGSAEEAAEEEAEAPVEEMDEEELLLEEYLGLADEEARDEAEGFEEPAPPAEPPPTPRRRRKPREQRSADEG